MPYCLSCRSWKWHADQWRQTLQTTGLLLAFVLALVCLQQCNGWYPDRLREGSRVHTTVSARSAAAHVPACPGHSSTAVSMLEQYRQQLGNTAGDNEQRWGSYQPQVSKSKSGCSPLLFNKEKQPVPPVIKAVGPKVSPTAWEVGY